MITKPSENILKLRELTKKIYTLDEKKKMLNIIDNIKIIIDDNLKELNDTKQLRSKVKIYDDTICKIIEVINEKY